MIPEPGKRYIITGFEDGRSLEYGPSESFNQAAVGREVVVDSVNPNNSGIVYVQFLDPGELVQHRDWEAFRRRRPPERKETRVLWYPILSEVLPYTAQQLAEWDAYDLAEE